MKRESCGKIQFSCALLEAKGDGGIAGTVDSPLARTDSLGSYGNRHPEISKHEVAERSKWHRHSFAMLARKFYQVERSSKRHRQRS
jgi:hypothetical protein